MAALALLIAQIGATSHAYAHDIVAGVSASLHDGAATHNPCSDCLAYAPLLSAAGTPTALPLMGHQAPGTGESAAADSLVERTPTHAFRSRAPPFAI